MSTLRYMEHPQHGRMPVYTDAEVKANEANGWKIIDVDAKPEPEPVEPAPPREVLTMKRK